MFRGTKHECVAPCSLTGFGVMVLGTDFQLFASLSLSVRACVYFCLGRQKAPAVSSVLELCGVRHRDI